MQVVDQASCSVMGPVVHVAEPCSNWQLVSMYLRSIDRYQRAREVLRNACFKTVEEREEDRVAGEALLWGSIACEHRVVELCGGLLHSGGLLLAGIGTLAFKAAYEAEPQYQELQEGGAA